VNKRPSSSRFRQSSSGAAAAEFALILPLALIFLFGIIDAGRYLWSVNQGLKAVQIGARWAAATELLTGDLVDYSFVIDGGLTQGDPVPISAFPGIDCVGDNTTVTCTCAPSGTCDSNYMGNQNNTAWQNLVTRMSLILPALQAGDVRVSYRCDPVNNTEPCLGFAGDPNGPDVAPFVTVSIENVQFSPMMLFGGASFNLPTFSQTLTMEDGQGVSSN